MAVFSSSTINLTAAQPKNSDFGIFKLENSGASPLKFKAEPTNKWLNVFPSQGEIKPGESPEIYVRALGYGLRPSIYTGGFHLYLSDRPATAYIPTIFIVRP